MADRRGVLSLLAGWLACTAVATAPAVVWAHHSFAMYDQSKSFTLAGTVAAWDWANPHISLTLLVKAPTGDVRWELAGQSVSSWSRLGMHAQDVKVGDRITVDLNPARAGGNNGYVRTITVASGRTFGEAPASSDKPHRDSLANPLEAPH